MRGGVAAARQVPHFDERDEELLAVLAVLEPVPEAPEVVLGVAGQVPGQHVPRHLVQRGVQRAQAGDVRRGIWEMVTTQVFERRIKFLSGIYYVHTHTHTHIYIYITSKKILRPPRL